MKIAILGTGMVGRAHAKKLSELGHEVIMGTRDVQKTLSLSSDLTNIPFSQWHTENPKVKLVTFLEAALDGEIVIEALNGQAVVELLKSFEESLANKILIDISNPLDFQEGVLPTLFVSNMDSLGEQIQNALPATKVVKAFNAMSANIQIDPNSYAGGDHHLFVCGNDNESKARVIELAKNWYGWRNVIDLGDISTARGTEMLLPLWLRLWNVLGTTDFNFKVAKNKA